MFSRNDFKNFDFHHMESWPSSARRGVLLVLAVLTFMMGCFIIDRPQSRQLAKMIQEEKSLKDQLAVVIPQAILQQAQVKQLKQLTDLEKHYREAVAKPEQLGTILEDLTRLASKHQLGLVLLKPSAVQQDNFYARIPVDIRAVGSFSQMVQFLSQLAYLDYYLYPGQMMMTLAGGKTPSQKTSSLLPDALTLEMTTEIYYYSPKPKEEKKDENKKH